MALGSITSTIMHRYPVTDERSAGFQALGLSMAEGYQVGNIFFIEPLEYLMFVFLMEKANNIQITRHPTNQK